MKNYLTKLALVVAVLIAGAEFVGADQYDKKTVITIDEAMQVPNTTLQPGTYVIKLVDSNSNRHIVQFWDKDEKHVIATILAIPNERLRATGKSVFAFWEVPAGQPKALRAWFYPGDDFGQEFAYRKEEASRITASNSGATVPVNDEESATATAAAEPAPAPAPIATAEPAPAPAEIAAAPVQSAAPAPEATPETPPANPAPATVDTNSDAQLVSQAAPSETLPKTASNLPLLGLIGMLSIVAALGLNLIYNRS